MHYHGHRQRLKARLNELPEKMSDYEILELLLGYVLTRRDTKPLAKELLERCGGLRGVIDARPEEYKDMLGVGPGVLNFIVLLREFLSRYAESPVRNRERLCTPEEVARLARLRLGRLDHEEVWLAFVDNRNRLISWEKAVNGSVNSASIHPRDIMERALVLKASGFILVHNHPGGDPSPSEMDLNITRSVEYSAKTLHIRFLDHVIVTDTACYSMMSDGLL